MPKIVGARTHPCFTPLQISKGSDVLNSPLLLRRLNALLKSIKATYSGLLCSRHLCCTCRTETTMSIVDLPVLKPH